MVAKRIPARMPVHTAAIGWVGRCGKMAHMGEWACGCCVLCASTDRYCLLLLLICGHATRPTDVVRANKCAHPSGSHHGVLKFRGISNSPSMPTHPQRQRSPEATRVFRCDVFLFLFLFETYKVSKSNLDVRPKDGVKTKPLPV